MRFRSGTLGKSLKRWGPKFPSTRSFKRKQFSWQYVTLDNSALLTGGGTTDIIVFDQTDWIALSDSNVRNVSMDLNVGIVWTPTTTGTTFNSHSVRGAMFILDADDTGQTLATTLASTRALWWNQTAMNLNTAAFADVGANWSSRAINWKVKRTARFLKADDELRFMVAFSGSNADDVISDARLFIFGRISWETP